MEKKKEDSIIFESFLQRLKYNSQTFHIILFSSPKGYEYNIDTRKVRPLDSILWYDISKEQKAVLFSKYLSSYCESQALKFEEDYTYSTNCMKEYNGHLSIDLDRLGKNLMLSNKGSKASNELVDSYFVFKSYLDYLYARNEKMLRYIIGMQEDLL